MCFKPLKIIQVGMCSQSLPPIRAILDGAPGRAPLVILPRDSAVLIQAGHLSSHGTTKRFFNADFYDKP